MNTPPAKHVVPLTSIEGESMEEKKLLLDLAAQALEFVRTFSWCGGLREQYFGNGVGGIIGIFLVRISPVSTDVDEWLWIVVGDVPPAYLVLDDAKTPSEALSAYISEMSRWVDAVEKGETIADLIPVNAPPTSEYAALLHRRLKMLEEDLLPQFRDDERFTEEACPKPN